jgi:transposase InsO family protein
MKYQFMKTHRQEFALKRMCEVLLASRAGFYAWLKKPESKRKKEDKKLLAKIKESFERSRKNYGYRRVQEGLEAQNEPVDKHRIARLMKENNLKPKTRKRFKVTTDSKHNKPVYENKLQRQFNDATGSNQRWVSDITYLPTSEGWLYLAVVIDLYSRKVVGWSMSDRIKEGLVIDALRMALFRRKVSSKLLLHSDRGSQYSSENYQQLLRQHQIECGMSRKGNCWDNAVAESFFHTLKTECTHHERFKTREEARKVVFDYIEVFYNHHRRHSYLGYVSPAQYENLTAAK